MTTMTVALNSDPLAAAVAAAAELAKSGGSFAFSNSYVPKVGQGALSISLNGTATPSTFHGNEVSPVSNLKSPETIPCSEGEDEYDGDHDETEEDVERRIARSRERNREHARRTRLRKKAQLEALQSKVKGLQAESEVLKQSLEECSIATILVGLSHKKSRNEDTVLKSLLQTTLSDTTCTKDASEILQMVGSKRKRFVSADSIDKTTSSQPLQVKIDGRMTLIGGGRTHINWKTGVYSDENGVQKQLTNDQLESLRRERNRMHAKMTRDRKKNFIATIEKAIDELESKNVRMKEVLSRVVQTHFQQKTSERATTTSPSAPHLVSPDCSAVLAPMQDVTPLLDRPAKKVCHGFAISSS